MQQHSVKVSNKMKSSLWYGTTKRRNLTTLDGAGEKFVSSSHGIVL